MCYLVPKRADVSTHLLTDEELRWLHGDESCRPTGVVRVGPQIPEDMIDGAKTTDEDLPLCRFGPGGAFNRDIRAEVVCAPRTARAKDGQRRRGVSSFVILVIGAIALGCVIAGIVMAVRP